MGGIKQSVFDFLAAVAVGITEPPLREYTDKETKVSTISSFFLSALFFCYIHSFQ